MGIFGFGIFAVLVFWPDNFFLLKKRPFYFGILGFFGIILDLIWNFVFLEIFRIYAFVGFFF
jgi:uncharacterized membrane protein